MLTISGGSQCNCGGLGYTIEVHDLLGEVMVGCHPCSIRAQESDSNLEDTAELMIDFSMFIDVDLEQTQELPRLDIETAA